MPNRSLVTALAAIAALALTATPAFAKGVESVTACGQSECVSAGADEVDDELIFGGGAPTGPPATAEGWYRVELEIGVPGQTETLTLRALPQSGYSYSRDEIGGALWSRMGTEQQAFYRGLTAGLTPISGAKLQGLSNPTLPAANNAPPAQSDPGDDSTFPWLIVLAAALTALAAAWILRRMRRRTLPHATQP